MISMEMASFALFTSSTPHGTLFTSSKDLSSKLLPSSASPLSWLLGTVLLHLTWDLPTYCLRSVLYLAAWGSALLLPLITQLKNTPEPSLHSLHNPACCRAEEHNWISPWCYHLLWFIPSLVWWFQFLQHFRNLRIQRCPNLLCTVCQSLTST